MGDTTILGGVLGQLGQTVKQAAKQVVKIPEEMAQDAGGQVGGAKKEWQSDEERITFLRDLYGSKNQILSAESQKKSVSSVRPSADASAFVETTADKKAMADKEEQKKLIELRNQLHKENYYDPTFNPVKNPPAGAPLNEAGGEERPAEKVENEKRQEMQELQQKEQKKPPPLAIVREQNKAEMFRGAAG